MHMSFFDKDVHCEPKWSNWFDSYIVLQLYFVEIAQRTECGMVIASCEMVLTDRQEGRCKLLVDIRTAYTGTLSYNTDKYQEKCVMW